MPPRMLAKKLAGSEMQVVALCGTNGQKDIGLRWNGEWVGSRTASPPDGLRAAPCLRLPSAGNAARWENVLRDPYVTVTPSNIASPSGDPEALRDGERDERKTQVIFYLLWDWFDGTLLEGW